MSDHFGGLSENCVKADDATVESLEELELVFLRTLHVYDVDRVVLRLPVLASLNLWMGILVQRDDESKSRTPVVACLNFVQVQGLL